MLAPEAAHDAKDGGALVPVLAFGIPGSDATAVLMAALLLHGLAPGRELMTDKLPLVFVLIWSLFLSNWATSLVGVMLVGPLARLTTLRLRAARVDCGEPADSGAARAARGAGPRMTDTRQRLVLARVVTLVVAAAIASAATDRLLRSRLQHLPHGRQRAVAGRHRLGPLLVTLLTEGAGDQVMAWLERLLKAVGTLLAARYGAVGRSVAALAGTIADPFVISWRVHARLPYSPRPALTAAALALPWIPLALLRGSWQVNVLLLAVAVAGYTALLLWRRVVTVEELAALRGVVRRTSVTPT